ncbi:Amoebiasin-1 [Entamoeba marina]
MSLTEENHPQHKLIKVGNPTTGFSWAVEEKPEGIQVDIDYISEQTEEPVCGRGGVYKITVTGNKVCKGKLILGYKRSWEQKAAQKQYPLELTVE